MSEITGPDNVVVIKVIGVGGAGNNAVNRMIEAGTKNVDFIAVNTDKPALSDSRADEKLQIGAKLTKGQGAGSDPEIGKRAAEENRNEIAKILEGTDMLFVACGMGGGTGTGAAPIIAEIAQEMGILTVGVVTTPFKHEGGKRMRRAEEGVLIMSDKVDAMFVIPNERIKEVAEQKVTLLNAFKLADEVLYQSINSISDLVKRTDYVNLDFADVTTIMKNAGRSHMGVGRAAGKDRAEVAVGSAIQSKLMETSIDGAQAILINFMGSSDMGLEEVNEASLMVEQLAHPECNIIFGAGIDETLGDEIIITIVATQFDDSYGMRDVAPPQPLRPVINPSHRQYEAPAYATVAPEPEPMPEPVAPPPPPVQPPEPEERSPYDDILELFTKKPK